MPAPFAETIAAAYRTEGASLDLGRGVHEGALHREAEVRVPLATLNRHGLIAGATGTGKTKTLQVMTEQLSAAGVAVLVADVKGDVSGLAVPGEADGPAAERMADLGLPFTPAAFPVEFLSLGGIGPGVPVRASVSDFGPAAAGQGPRAPTRRRSRASALVFHYADANGLPLVDLEDLRALLMFLTSDAGQAGARGDRRPVQADRRRAAALPARPADGRRRHLLRGAGVRRRRPAAHAPRTAAAWSRASSSRRSRTVPRCGRPR